jgi:two-component system response regulator MtrA
MKQPLQVLVVEDDEAVARMLARFLKGAGFEVLHELDGPPALERFESESIDLVLLDLILPTMDGLDVCRRMRETSDVPILMLSARSAADEAVEGFEAGADDYIRKPVALPELKARIDRALERFGPSTDRRLEVGRFVIDPASKIVSKDGEKVRLSSLEFRLLYELMSRAGSAIEREDLLKRAWGYDFLGSSRLVDMAIKRLRTRIEDDSSEPSAITTVRGVGYRFETG